MKINIFTIIVGNAICNASCPYCVSRMTPDCGVAQSIIEPNYRNLSIACRFAKDCGVSTVLLTGKGEPTLFPDLIDQYVRIVRNYFPFIELQTNGILLSKNHNDIFSRISKWYQDGLTTVSISIAHYDEKRNSEIFSPNKNYNIWNLVDKLHQEGISVRISCVLVKGYIDSLNEIGNLVLVCRERNVEQLTVREVSQPDDSKDSKTAEYVSQHSTPNLTLEMRKLLDTKGAKFLLDLPHGGVVYDWDGQNICLANCLTGSTDSEDIRQLIFFPDGHLRYDWRYPGAIIL